MKPEYFEGECIVIESRNQTAAVPKQKFSGALADYVLGPADARCQHGILCRPGKNENEDWNGPFKDLDQAHRYIVSTFGVCPTCGRPLGTP